MTEMELIKALLTKKSKQLEKLKVKAEKSLAKAPEGSLILSRSNGNVQYYHKTDSSQRKGKYISEKDKKLVGELAQKDYDQKLLKLITKAQKGVDKILGTLPDVEVEQIYNNLSEARKKYVHPHILTDEQFVEQWMKVQYSGKVISADTPVIITERGEKVRSKTEKILADKLCSLGIPYRYEYPVKLKGYGVVYPDFTLLNVSERREIYLEHFGMMDNPRYCQNAILKLEEYAKNGIYPGKNLLVTFETSQQPLNMKIVEDMLKESLLMLNE